LGVLEKRRMRGILGHKEEKAEEMCVMRNFIMPTPHRILVG
jgi:hypothetical protein